MNCKWLVACLPLLLLAACVKHQKPLRYQTFATQEEPALVSKPEHHSHSKNYIYRKSTPHHANHSTHQQKGDAHDTSINDH